MSERPFMQLYVSDFLGDTLELSTEGIGAYMLLLMAMWNAGGSLPDDEVKLSRICRMSAKKWRAVATDILNFFDRDNGRITHQRLLKELQKSEGKSQSRANAGSLGGKAKALKDNNHAVANATSLPQHLPEARSQKAATQQEAAKPPNKFDLLEDQLFEAAGIASFRDERHPKLKDLSPIRALIEKGYALDADILPVIRERSRNKTFSSWRFFEQAIVDAVRAKNAIPARPANQQADADWEARMRAFTTDGTWLAWGPKPGERGCRVPPELLKPFENRDVA